MAESPTDKDRIAQQIARIQQLSTELKHELAFVNRPHAAFGALLMELDLLAIQLAKIKRRLS